MVMKICCESVIQKSVCLAVKVQESGFENQMSEILRLLGTVKAPDCCLERYQDTFHRKPDGCTSYIRLVERKYG